MAITPEQAKKIKEIEELANTIESEWDKKIPIEFAGNNFRQVILYWPQKYAYPIINALQTVLGPRYEQAGWVVTVEPSTQRDNAFVRLTPKTQ